MPELGRPQRLPRISAATNPTRPAISARSVPTGNPSSRLDTHASAATSTMLVASTTTANTIPFIPTSNYSGAYQIKGAEAGQRAGRAVEVRTFGRTGGAVGR